MLLVRNPWGMTNYTGPWGATYPCWWAMLFRCKTDYRLVIIGTTRHCTGNLVDHTQVDLVAFGLVSRNLCIISSISWPIIFTMGGTSSMLNWIWLQKRIEHAQGCCTCQPCWYCRHLLSHYCEPKVSHKWPRSNWNPSTGVWRWRPKWPADPKWSECKRLLGATHNDYIRGGAWSLLAGCRPETWWSSVLHCICGGAVWRSESAATPCGGDMLQWPMC